jgi:hypothetical protein
MAVRRANHVAWRRVGEETVLVHLKDKKIYVLNSSGGFFWHRLDGQLGARDLLATLAVDEPIPDNAPSHLESFLADLEAADLVVTGDRPNDTFPKNATSPDYPLPGFVPPELVWQEEIRNFGASCAFLPAGGPPCDSAPST